MQQCTDLDHADSVTYLAMRRYFPLFRPISDALVGEVNSREHIRHVGR